MEDAQDIRIDLQQNKWLVLDLPTPEELADHFKDCPSRINMIPGDTKFPNGYIRRKSA